MKKKLNLINNDQARLNELVSLMNKIGFKLKAKRKGDVNFRMDATGTFFDLYVSLAIEFGKDHLNCTRQLLEDYSILCNRYNYKKNKVLLFSVFLDLPNRRSEYYKVVDDIYKVTSVKIYSISIDQIEQMIKNNEKINKENLKNYFIY